MIILKLVVVYYSIYGNQIIENKFKEQVKDFIDIITNKNNRIIDDEKMERIYTLLFKCNNERMDRRIWRNK